MYEYYKEKLHVNYLWELKGKKNVQGIYMFLQFLWQSIWLSVDIFSFATCFNGIFHYKEVFLI